MPDIPPPLPAGAATRRSWKLVALVAFGVVGVAAWLIPGTDAYADLRHRRVRERIKAQCERAMDSLPRDGNAVQRFSKAERGRYEIIRAINTAMANWPFYARQSVVSEKFAALADRLDATAGEDFKTFDGCGRLLVMCDEASWTFYDYPWITSLREMEKDGDIPKLPELGQRWENDPRRKAEEARDAARDARR